MSFKRTKLMRTLSPFPNVQTFLYKDYTLCLSDGTGEHLLSIACHTGNRQLPEDELNSILDCLGFDLSRPISTRIVTHVGAYHLGDTHYYAQVPAADPSASTSSIRS